MKGTKSKNVLMMQRSQLSVKTYVCICWEAAEKSLWWSLLISIVDRPFGAIRSATSRPIDRMPRRTISHAQCTLTSGPKRKKKRKKIEYLNNTQTQTATAVTVCALTRCLFCHSILKTTFRKRLRRPDEICRCRRKTLCWQSIMIGR